MVNVQDVYTALDYLKCHFPAYMYKDFAVNTAWEDTISDLSSSDVEPPHANSQEDINLPCQNQQLGTGNEAQTCNLTNDTVPELSEQERLQGIQLDTCSQPVNFGQDVLDSSADNIYCIAPAEGNKPMRFKHALAGEAITFSCKFPHGSNDFNQESPVKISMSRYFNSRLFHVDPRFQDPTYLFYAQYLSEVDEVCSQVSIAMRQGKHHTNKGETITADMLADKNNVSDILKADHGYRFMQPIRGTPPHWQRTLKDLFAMICQLGIPTWFCSFSSADMRWNTLFDILLRQKGDTRPVDQLDWAEKCELLRNNPVTSVRLFDHRVHAFINQVILTDAQPFGKVTDYFFRVEFQMRGSPHIHCLFWVDEAPK